MSFKNYTSFLLVLFLFPCLTNHYAQVFSDMVIENKEFFDSLKTAEYPYVLPIWGQEATSLGFDLPYSAGISVNYLWQESGILINNLSIGFNNSPMQNIDQLVRFNNTTASSNILNIRPDIWLFPFLNIYGIFALSKTSTEVDFGIWLPDNIGDPESSEWSEIISTSTKAEFEGVSFGFGLTPTIGIAGGWFALDMNFTWTDIDALKDPAFGFVFGPRLGKTFRFNEPDMNIAFWVGGFRLKIGSSTEGNLALSDLFDLNEFGDKIETGYERVSQAQQNADDWWNSLTPIEQKNPTNIAKYQAANRVIEGAANLLNSASGVAGNIENATVQYSLEKKQEDMWNFIVGTQFQLNKHWMFRLEYGFLSARHQFLGGIQYRFGL